VSVCPYVRPVYRPLQQRAAGLLLGAPRQAVIDRQRQPPGARQHGAQQQTRAVSRCQLT